MAAPLPYCSTCRVRYRSGWARHASTEGHRAKAYRAATGKGGREMRGSKAARRGRAARSARRSVDEWLAGHLETVRTHRRRRPLDGPARSVKVRRYRRVAPYRDPGHLIREGGHVFRVWWDATTGEPKRVMLASARAARELLS